MIAAALHAELDQFIARTRRNNPLFCKAAEGSLTPEHISRYLTNLHHLLLHSPAHIARASERAKDLGDGSLAKHYDHKLGEEIGHEVWAERDLEKVSAQVAVPASREIVPSMRELLGFIAAIIEEHPSLYLSYALFAEGLTVILGPEWLQLLEERCGIPRSSMTVVANHAELDREHVQEALDQIDDLVGDPRKLPRMREVILESMAHFDRFCAEITQERAHDARASRSSQHVSAA
jgi:pyrroloquinoline quinone (PQQ) biosynthesis protein C